MRKISILSAALMLTATLAGCKGRTTDTVSPDGSQPQQVKILETASATEARDSLRQRVKELPASVSDSNVTTTNQKSSPSNH